MKLNCKFIIIFLHFISSILLGQFTQNGFDHISVSDGLSVGTVNAILQDRIGFLWFGTEDGLNRYDGYNFDVYTYSPTDSNSLSNNYIWALVEDDIGNIWIGTDGGGLNKFDPVTNKFISYYHDENDSNCISSNVIQSLLIDSQNNLWIGTWGGGLCKYDYKNDSFQRINLKSNLEEEIKYIWTIFEDVSGLIWIGTDKDGLLSYDPISHNIISYKINGNDKNSISSNSITSICEDKYNNLWVGTYGGGLNKFEKGSKKFYKYGINPKWNNSITDKVILKIIKDSNGKIWAASMEKGIFVYDEKKDAFKNYNFDIHDSYSINTNNIRSIYEDNSNNLWIGTMGKGLNKTNIKGKKFLSIKHKINNPNSLKMNFVFSVLEDAFGDLWLGTYGSGIGKLSKNQNKFIFYNHNPNNPTSLSGDNVRVIYEDSNQDIWIGTYPGGLSKYNRSSDTFYNFEVGEGEYRLNNSMVRTIFEDSQKILWIGTNGGGLSYFDPKNNKFTAFRNNVDDPKSISGDAILSLNEDSDGNLWVGTFSNGLNKFDKSTQTFERFINDPDNASSLSNNIITELFISSNGTLWIGTWGGGLNNYNESLKTFSSFSSANGLESDVVCGIVEDDNGLLWISTLKGVSSLNTNTFTFKNYNQSDGLLPSELNPSARTKSKDGWIYFGGVEGVNFFHPDSVYDSEFQPQVVITSFKKHNVEVKLNRNINFIDTVSLSYTEDNFSFEFSSLDYTNPNNNVYSYKLESFDKDWIVSGSRRYANYTHLNYGEYLFKVKGSNHDGVWSENNAQVLVIISPPFWSTWYFRIFVVFSFMLMGYYLYRKKIRNYERERLAQESFTERLIESQEQERKRIASGLHDSLGQNLLIVKNRALLGINSKSLEDAKNELNEISNSASLALDEIRQIAYNLHPYQLTRLGLTKAIQSIINNVRGLSNIEFQSSIDNIDDLFPKNSEINIYRILQESINNVLKHSGAKNVNVSVSLINDLVTLRVIDDGVGFDLDKIESKGFGMQNLTKRVSLLKGTLKIKSKLQSGTKILIKIPVSGDE